jgi:hypothetical protein
MMSTRTTLTYRSCVPTAARIAQDCYVTPGKGWQAPRVALIRPGNAETQIQTRGLGNRKETA